MMPGTIRVGKTGQRAYLCVSGGGGMIQDHESYECPYCGVHEGREKTGGVPQTFKLTAEEEAAWRRRSASPTVRE